MKNLILVTLSLVVATFNVYGKENHTCDVFEDESLTCTDGPKLAFVSSDESHDNSDIVEAANYWVENVYSFFGEAGLARIEIEGESNYFDTSILESPNDPYGSDPYGSDPYGSDPYGYDPYGYDPYGSGPYGSDPYGSDLYGYAPYGYDPYDSDPYDSDPYDSDPYGSDPYGSDPYGYDLYVSDPYDSDPYDSDPYDSDPYDSDPSSSDDPQDPYSYEGIEDFINPSTHPYYFDDNDDIFTAWGIDHDGHVWAWDDVTWHYVDSGGKDVGSGGEDFSSGAGEVFLTKDDGSIWIWYDYQFVPYKTRADAPSLDRIDATQYGDLVGVSPEGAVYLWDFVSHTWERLLESNGDNIHIALDIGETNLIMTTKDGQAWIYMLETENPKWQKVNWARRSLATRRIE